MQNPKSDKRDNKMNNNALMHMTVDESSEKPIKRRKKKDCKHCRNKITDSAQSRLAIISIPIDDLDINESALNSKQFHPCRDELHNQQLLPVLNGFLSDEKIKFGPSEKYWPRMMKTNSIYSEDHNQRKIKNPNLSNTQSINVEKKHYDWLQTCMYQLNTLRNCNAIKFIIIVTILSLLAVGAIALYIVFEPGKVQIIKQYFHLSKGINKSFVNYTDQPQRLIANVNALENITVLESNHNFSLLVTQTIDNEARSRAIINNYTQQKIEMPMSNSIAIRYCNNCYRGEICIALVDENVPTCKLAINSNDTTKCAGMCSINDQCHQLDTNIFRCVKMEHQCLDDEWACSNALCIPLVKLCDGHMNCYDHSDEYNCDCNLQTHFQCGKQTSCLPLEQRCDGKIDCWDATDEMNCTLSCPSINEFRCSNGECILKIRFCDGFKDCSDGSDEPYGCHGRCNKHEYTCQNKRCVTRNLKCNGEDDCGDGSDELYCKN